MASEDGENGADRRYEECHRGNRAKNVNDGSDPH
jgi:hypothetical protein